MDFKKEFIKLFKNLCISRHTWEVWSDLMTVMACSFSNAADRSGKRHDEREREYEYCINRLGSVGKAAEIMGVIVNAFESDPDQDFLGSLYMELELGNHWKGQFFTPYHVSKMMAKMTFSDTLENAVKEKGWASVADPCIGGGAMLIAAANMARESGINFQESVLFTGQDIDRTTAMMAYVQLCVLGCPGYVVVANSLTNPMVGDPIMPTEREGQEYWYTPFYYTDIWNLRRMGRLFGKRKEVS